jgi:hypothetical protein
MFSLQQNWRTEQNRFCLEAREMGEEIRGRGGPNNIMVNTYKIAVVLVNCIVLKYGKLL